MNFLIKDEYIDLRTVDIELVKREAKEGNPYAVVALVYLHIDGYGRDIPIGDGPAWDVISNFDWASNPITKIVYAKMYRGRLKGTVADKEKRFLEIASDTFVDSLIAAEGSYYAQIHAGELAALGFGSPVSFQKTQKRVTASLQAELSRGAKLYQGLALIKRLIDFEVKELDDTKVQGNEQVRFVLWQINTSMASKLVLFSPEEKTFHNRLGALHLLAAARGGHRRAQVNLGEFLTDPKVSPPMYAAFSDPVERQSIAEEVLKAAIEQDAEFARLYLGRLYRTQEKTSEAIETLKLLPSSDIAGQKELGEVLRDAGQIEEAKEILKSLVENGSFPEGMVLIGDIHYDAAEFSDAREWYSRRLKEQHESTLGQVYTRLVNLYLDPKTPAGNPDETAALILAEKAIALNGSSQLILAPDDKLTLGSIRRMLRGRTIIGDPSSGLRRIQPNDKIPAVNGQKIFVLPEDPTSLSSAIEVILDDKGIFTSGALAGEIATLTQSNPSEARRWHARAGERGSAVDMQSAIKMYLQNEGDVGRDVVEALRLCRLALREPKKKGIALGKIRDDIMAIKKSLTGENPGETASIWILQDGRPSHPVTDQDLDLSVAVILPQSESEREEWYRNAAAGGSKEAQRLLTNMQKNTPEVAELAAVAPLQNALPRGALCAPSVEKARRKEMEGALAKAHKQELTEVPSDSENEYEFSKVADAADDIFVNPIDKAFRKAADLFSRGDEDAALSIYEDLIQTSLTLELEVAERLAAIKTGATFNPQLAHKLYDDIVGQMAEHLNELPDDVEQRLDQILERILDEAWTEDENGIIRRIRHGVESEMDIHDIGELIFFMDTQSGLDELRNVKSLDATVEIATRLGLGGKNYKADYLASFRYLSDLLLDRATFPPQDTSAPGPLPGDSAKRVVLQRLWDKCSLKVSSVDTDDNGNEEYGTPGFNTEAPEFFVPQAAVSKFRTLLKHGRFNARHAL